jgi:hypothetical protein
MSGICYGAFGFFSVLISGGDHPHAVRAAAVQTGTGPAAWCGCEMVDMMATV